MDKTRIKALKAIDSKVRTEYLLTHSEYVYSNTPDNRTENDRYTIAWNVAKWHQQKFNESALTAARRDGVIAPERILLTDNGVVVVLTRSGKAFAYESGKITGKKEIY